MVQKQVNLWKLLHVKIVQLACTKMHTVPLPVRVVIVDITMDKLDKVHVNLVLQVNTKISPNKLHVNLVMQVFTMDKLDDLVLEVAQVVLEGNGRQHHQANVNHVLVVKELSEHKVQA